MRDLFKFYKSLFPVTEGNAADAELQASIKEVMGLQSTDDITTQAPIYTAAPIGT